MTEPIKAPMFTQPNDEELPISLPMPGGILRIKMASVRAIEVLVTDFAATLRMERAQKRLEQNETLNDAAKTQLLYMAMNEPITDMDYAIAMCEARAQRLAMWECAKPYNPSFDLTGLCLWLTDKQGKDHTQQVFDQWLEMSGLTKKKDEKKGNGQEGAEGKEDPTTSSTSSSTDKNLPPPSPTSPANP